jgi:hypothetical protein
MDPTGFSIHNESIVRYSGFTSHGLSSEGIYFENKMNKKYILHIRTYTNTPFYVCMYVSCRRDATDPEVHNILTSFHARILPYHDDLARLQVADGGDRFQVWRVLENIWNKQSRIADKGWASRLVLAVKKRNMLRNITKGLGS